MRTLRVIIVLLAGVAYGQGTVSTLSSDVSTCIKTNVFTVKGKTYTDYGTSQAQSWRFVHDAKRIVVTPWFSGGTTYTPYQIVEAKTWALATGEIGRLKLTLTDEQRNDMAQIAAQTNKPLYSTNKVVVVVTVEP